MNIEQFVNKWRHIELSEVAVAQSHFLDICQLVDHPSPTDFDPLGEVFTFEVPVLKASGNRGRADAWYKDKFIWEYKRPGYDLEKAYDQLLMYRESLGNPPLLITSDTHDIFIHTNFNNSEKIVFRIDFESLLHSNGFELLKNAFFNPYALAPKRTQQQITQATADTFIDVANSIQYFTANYNEKERSEKISHFIVRLLFCLFSQDLGLLPSNLFTEMISQYDKVTSSEIADFSNGLKNLFSTMQQGGYFGYHKINYFNGGLFDDNFVPELPTEIVRSLQLACSQNWANIDPTIFGTLFERVIDKSKRAQLGAHYTSIQDIELLIEPVIMEPLRHEWSHIKTQTEKLLESNTSEAFLRLSEFSQRLANIKILDPACGSGNFLYVALKRLLDLQKEVITYAVQHGLPEISLTVSPTQLFGIEINQYAFELAQITTWIGYLQWRFENGFRVISEPILKAIHTIQHRDAVLEKTEGQYRESRWPSVDYIVGNPPFLGSRKMRQELGDEYCDQLISVYSSRVRGLPDLVCYWFEKAARQLEMSPATRIGLIATQAIRGGNNRQALKHIKEVGNIFFAWSDREWILDGATVHVSLIGFDGGLQREKHLNGKRVSAINSDLTSGTDITTLHLLRENAGISFQGDILRGPFDISTKEFNRMLADNHNPNGEPNNKVLRRRKTGRDILHNAKDSFVIDFGVNMSLEQASNYILPFEHVHNHVLPMRQKTKQAASIKYWWIHWNPRPEMRDAIGFLERYLATPRVSKHRIFVWLEKDVLPDAQLVVFARSDDYFFGVLHSKPHEIWARRSGTQLRDAESGFRYTSTTTFQTFPLPWSPGSEPTQDHRYLKIADIAEQLNRFRNEWLNPKGIGIHFSEKIARQRNLNNLYNALDLYRNQIKGQSRQPAQWNKFVKSIVSLEDIEQLDYLHEALDSAVIESYGWNYEIQDGDILSKLLELNLRRSSRNGINESIMEGDSDDDDK